MDLLLLLFKDTILLMAVTVKEGYLECRERCD